MRLLSGLSIDRLRERDEAEVRGYAELLQLIFESHADIPMEERYIQQLHGILLARGERDAWHRGKYKTNPNHLEARSPDGGVEVIFRTATPFETSAKMADLVSRTSAMIDAGSVHRLVVAARFIVEVLAIHPFQDGNGRLSRALTTLMLLQAGYEYVPFASLERIVEDNKADYYVALHTSETSMRDDSRAFGAWLLFFLRSLGAQQHSLLAKLQIECSMLRLSDVQERILTLLDEHGAITSTLVSKTLSIPARTVRYHLNALIQRSQLSAAIVLCRPTTNGPLAASKKIDRTREGRTNRPGTIA